MRPGHWTLKLRLFGDVIILHAVLMPTDLPRPSQDRPLPSPGPRWSLSRCLSSLLRIGVPCLASSLQPVLQAPVSWPWALCELHHCQHTQVLSRSVSPWGLPCWCWGHWKISFPSALPTLCPGWAGPTKRNLVSQWSYAEGGQERRPRGSEPWRCLTQIHPALVLQELYSWCRTPVFRYYVSSVGISLP